LSKRNRNKSVVIKILVYSVNIKPVTNIPCVTDFCITGLGDVIDFVLTIVRNVVVDFDVTASN